MTPEVSQMGQNVLVLNKNDVDEVFADFFLFVSKALHEWNTALLMSPKPSEHNDGWKPAGLMSRDAALPLASKLS